MLGYYQDLPSYVCIKFIHENQVLVEPAPLIERGDITLGYPAACGSNIIWKLLLFTDDNRCRRYRTWKARSSAQVNLIDAVEMAKAYLQACHDPVLRELDPEHCAKIGGGADIAIIKPVTGFDWVAGFAPGDPGQF